MLPVTTAGKHIPSCHRDPPLFIAILKIQDANPQLDQIEMNRLKAVANILVQQFLNGQKKRKDFVCCSKLIITYLSGQIKAKGGPATPEEENLMKLHHHLHVARRLFLDNFDNND